MKPRLFSEMNKVFTGVLLLSMINSALAKRKETAGTQLFQLNYNWSFPYYVTFLSSIRSIMKMYSFFSVN